MSSDDASNGPLVGEKVTCTVTKGRAGEQLFALPLLRAACVSQMKDEIMRVSGVHTLEQDLSMDGESLCNGTAQPLLGAPDCKTLSLVQVEVSPPTIVDFLVQEDLTSQQTTLKWLGSLDVTRTTAIAPYIIEHTSLPQGIREAAIATLGRLGKAAVPYSTELVALLEGEERGLKMAALQVLRDFGEDATIHADEVLNIIRGRDSQGKLLKENDFELWKTALQTYSCFGSKGLKLESCKIDSANDVSAIAPCFDKLGDLEELVVSNNRGFGSLEGARLFSEQTLTTLTSLKVLDVSCCGFSEAGAVQSLASGLVQLRALESLDLSRNALGNPESARLLAQSLCELRSLRSLHLCACGFEDPAVVAALAPGLAKAESLDVLVLRGNSAFGSVEGAQSIAKDVLPYLSRLQTLDVSACNLYSIDAARALGPGLASLAVLKVLKLGGRFNEEMQNTGFGGPEGAKVLSDVVLPGLHRLETLDLSRCGPQDTAAAMVLAPSLCRAGKLLELSLSQNRGFGLAEAAPLFSTAILAELRGLRALDIHSCGFDTAESVQAVAQDLGRLERLEKLVIAGNPGFGTDSGAVLLAEEVLPGMRELKTLDIGACMLQDEGLVRQLTVSVSQLKDLEVFCVCYNQGFSDPECVQVLVETAMALRKLREVDLRFCGVCCGAISGHDRDLLQAAVPANCFVIC